MKFNMKNNNVEDEEELESTNTDLISVERNKVMFYSDVTPASCFKLIASINKAKEYVAVQNALSEFDEYNKIYLHICSDGGEVFPVLAVIDIILKSKINIITVSEGCVASAGVLLALAGKERYMRPNGYMLLHELRSCSYGKYTVMKDEMKCNDILMKDMKKYILNRCENKKLGDKIDKILEHDIIWNAPRCKKYGLINKII